MSFVNLVMTPDFITIVSDGQITESGQITQTHFKKFIVSPQHFVVAITGFQLITENIKKKFYYQPNLSFDEAVKFLIQELEKYKDKRLHFGQTFICYNAIIAGFPTNHSTPIAMSFHIENQQLTRKVYEKSALISLLPDDIDFNPNFIISENLRYFDKNSRLFHIQSLQRNALYKVAAHSKTVNRTVFQEIIKKD